MADGQVVTGAQEGDEPRIADPSPAAGAAAAGAGDASPAGAASAAFAAGASRPEDPGQAIDLALVGQALRGELDAFNQLVVRHQDRLFSLVFRLVPDRDQAADVVQEAFFGAYRNLASFRGGSFSSWLGRIAVNAAMDLQRARRRRPVQPYPELEDESWQPPAESGVEPESKTLAIERSRALAAALARLPADQRNCIVLYDVQGYDYAEIARIMGTEVGTVKSRIHRGRVALRALLEPARELFRG
jgi:RNA polymerase sigma-70 factor, ECF subfamily